MSDADHRRSMHRPKACRAATISLVLLATLAAAQTRPAASRPADPDAARRLASWKEAVIRARSNYVEWLEVDRDRIETRYGLAVLNHAEAMVKLLEAGPADRDRLVDDVVRFQIEQLKLKAELFRQRDSHRLVALMEAEARVVELEHQAERAGDRATAADRRDLVVAQLQFAKLSLEHAIVEKSNSRERWEREVAELTVELKAAEERLAAEGGATTKPATRPAGGER